MRFLCFLVSLGLYLPLVAQAESIAFHDKFYVRLDNFWYDGLPYFQEIYDIDHDTNRTFDWFKDKYGVEWFLGMKEGESRSAHITIHSSNGRPDTDTITRVSFVVDGCQQCGYTWVQNDVYKPGFSDSAGDIRIALGAPTPVISGFDLFIPKNGVGNIREYTEDFGDALSAAFRASGLPGNYFFSFHDKGFMFSTSRDPFDDMLVTPLPASVLFLLAGLGGIGLLARRKRSA
jgi:hypothetical protein